LIHPVDPCGHAVYPFSPREKVPEGRMRDALARDALTPALSPREREYTPLRK
jgi:hypothetical protein